MKKIITIILGVLFINTAYSQIDSVLISSVKFKNSKFNNPHAGSGFLLTYKNKNYAVTAKHVLFFAKTDSMKTVSFGDDLKSWEFISKTSPIKKVLAGKLINENMNEPIVMPPKGDWLIFEINSKLPENTVVFEVRKTPLEINETVSFMGYPYKSKKAIKIRGKFIGLTKDGNLRLDVPRGTYNGCSGGPVFDSAGKIVGIVSMGYYNNTTTKMVFEPASLQYFKQVINNQ